MVSWSCASCVCWHVGSYFPSFRNYESERLRAYRDMRATSRRDKTSAFCFEQVTGRIFIRRAKSSVTPGQKQVTHVNIPNSQVICSYRTRFQGADVGRYRGRHHKTEYTKFLPANARCCMGQTLRKLPYYRIHVTNR